MCEYLINFCDVQWVSAMQYCSDVAVILTAQNKCKDTLHSFQKRLYSGADWGKKATGKTQSQGPLPSPAIFSPLSSFFPSLPFPALQFSVPASNRPHKSN